ncbi:coproporphyrinogen III oxidase family protein [Helicobacter sp. T3_23-1059]
MPFRTIKSCIGFLDKNPIQSLATRYASHSMQRVLKRSFKVRLHASEILPNGKPTMLYIHIPFCHTLCPYCSFHKYIYDENLARAYFEALREELKLIKAKGFDFHTLVVGGGTTLINEDELLKTLELCKNLFGIQEISCESDPTHIAPAQLERFKGLITRLSCGVQSFDDEILRKIGRYEKFGSSAQLQEKLAKAQGILPTLSIDLIFNFPNQTKEQLLRDLAIAKSLGAEQITTYPLMRSALTRSKIQSALGVALSDNEREFYELICAEFSGWKRNNAWGFGKINPNAKINDDTPQSNLSDEYVSSNHQYLGAGSGAFSFINGKLYINTFNLKDYCSAIAHKRNANMANAEFSRRDILRYVFLCELFEGRLNIAEFNANMQCNLEWDLALEIAGLRLSGAITNATNSAGEKILQCTDFGHYVCVVLMKEFYAGMDLVRATFRDEARLENAQKEELQSQSRISVIDIMREAKELANNAQESKQEAKKKSKQESKIISTLQTI